MGSRLYPCSIKTRKVLENPSPTPERFPETWGPRVFDHTMMPIRLGRIILILPVLIALDACIVQGWISWFPSCSTKISRRPLWFPCLTQRTRLFQGLYGEAHNHPASNLVHYQALQVVKSPGVQVVLPHPEDPVWAQTTFCRDPVWGVFATDQPRALRDGMEFCFIRSDLCVLILQVQQQIWLPW